MQNMRYMVLTGIATMFFYEIVQDINKETF